MSRVPRIRFKGFEEDWEQRKLGEVADKVVEKNFQLQERDVFTNSAEFGIIEQKDFFDHEIVNKNNIGGYYIVSPNDFVYNPRISVTAPVGPINRNKLCKRGIMSPLYTVFHPRNINEIFLEFFFKTNKWHKFMEYNGDSGARSDRFSIKTELFYAMTIPFPSHEEQSKVGICSESLDHLITLHQRKLEKLKIIKKSMLENIFPQNGEKTPKIRFSGFTGDWEQRKLGDIVREVTRVDENSNAPVMMITANDGFIEQSERYSTDNAGKSLKKYILLKKWELAYNHGASKIRPFGSCVALTRATNIRIPFVYHCFLSLEDNPEFLEQTLNGKNVENQLRKIVSSGARMDGLLNISFQEYTSIFIRCPIRKEQDKIAILIKSLDHLITIHQSKLGKLKKIKKSMLESMFV